MVKVLLIASLLGLFWLFLPVQAEHFLFSATNKSNFSQESVQQRQTYLLNVLPGGSRLTVNINPPATKIIVTSKSGDTAIRCGYNRHIYSCLPGSQLEITADRTNPIHKFWGQNHNEIWVQLLVHVTEFADGDKRGFK